MEPQRFKLERSDAIHLEVGEDLDLDIDDHYPFHVSVTVESGLDLPIADLTTSDPYVSITCNEKLVGKTETIKRNNKRPVWSNNFFSFPLVSIKQTLICRVFDENVHNDDTLMGIVEIDLQREYENRPRQRDAVPTARPYALHLAKNPLVIDPGGGKLMIKLQIKVYSSFGFFNAAVFN